MIGKGIIERGHSWMPAFTAGGDIVPDTDNARLIGSDTLGLLGIHIAPGYFLTESGAVLAVRNSANSAWANFGCNILATQAAIYAGTNIEFQNAASLIKTKALNTAYVALQGYGSGAFVEHARLAPNNFTLTNGLLAGALKGAAQNLDDIAQIEISKTDGIPIGTIKTAKVTKAHNSDLFDAAGLTDSVVIWQQPANSVLLAVKMRLETQFAGGAISSVIVAIGLAADPNGLVMETTNLVSDAADTEYHQRGAYWNEAANLSLMFKDAATDWVAYATAAGANLDQSTAGSIDFYFCYLEL